MEEVAHTVVAVVFVCLGLLLFFCLLLGSCVDLLDVLWVYSCLVTVWSLNKLG